MSWVLRAWMVNTKAEKRSEKKHTNGIVWGEEKKEKKKKENVLV